MDSDAIKVAGEGLKIGDLNTIRPSEWQAMLAGAVAGLTVDTSLFPIDTIKSRLQSGPGFFKSGGFSNLYRGLMPVLAGSVPNAALFFITYETIKDKLHQFKPFSPKGNGHIINHMLAASAGEAVSCLVRVPYEIIKMRSQTSISTKISNKVILSDIISKEGLPGLYRGFSSTIIRDLPFSAIQYPVWEKLKILHLRRNNRPVTPFESACYGSVAGAIAAFLTTPLDVVKSRIMLADQSESMASGGVISALKTVYGEKGIQGLFAGVVPRVIWISVGAAIFLGSYERTIKFLT